MATALDAVSTVPKSPLPREFVVGDDVLVPCAAKGFLRT